MPGEKGEWSGVATRFNSLFAGLAPTLLARTYVERLPDTFGVRSGGGASVPPAHRNHGKAGQIL
jgi:hypothetical protein